MNLKLFIIGLALLVLIAPKVAKYQIEKGHNEYYDSEWSPRAEEILKKWREQIKCPMILKSS